MTSLKAVSLATVGGAMALPMAAQAQEAKTPNIIIMLADDLGWGDVGFNGNSVVQTPALDAMAQNGAELTNFYTVSPLSSPSRASILTGRHPFRMGIYAAHTEAMKNGEITIPEICKKNGYATGMFGKWHLGWIEPESTSDRGYYSPPHYHGFEEVFATRSAVPTWDPALTPAGFNNWGNEAGKPWTGSRYMHNGVPATENLSGDDSRVIMDRVIPFIDEAVNEDKPFMACVWFHAPHEPVVAGPDYLAMYEDLENETQQHYYGCITAMDDQIARLIEHLKAIGEYENTIITFTSDNGPADGMTKKGVASAGEFRGHKHQVYEGGVRVPSLIAWPAGIKAGTKVDSQVITCDYLPTLVSLAGLKFNPHAAYLSDGIDVTAALNGEKMERENPFFIGWKRFYRGIYGRALVQGEFKYIYPEMSEIPELYNLASDPNETTNIIANHPEIAAEMERHMKELEQSFVYSDQGKDYKSY